MVNKILEWLWSGTAIQYVRYLFEMLYGSLERAYLRIMEYHQPDNSSNKMI